MKTLKAFCLLAFLSVGMMAQTTHQFGALDTTNLWTGNNTFQRFIFGAYTVATRPSTPVINMTIIVTDGNSTSDCTTGGGANRVLCSYNGSAWASIGGGGGGGGSMTWPGLPGIAVYAGGSAWGTSLTAPTGTIVGTTDTQTLTNKTVDGVTPTVFGYLDATSSIQTQLNGKAASNASTTVNGVTCTLASTCAPYGGTVAYTANHTIGAADIGKLVVMNCSGACTLTLSGGPSSTDWYGVESIGSTVASISLNSKNFNGAASVPVLLSFKPMLVFSDGVNYFGDAPLVQGANATLTPASNGLTIAASASSGMTNPMTTLGDIIYENATPAPARLAGPTSPNGIPQTLTNTPSGGAAQAEAWAIPGVAIDAQVGTSYTIPATDDVHLLTINNASPVALAGTNMLANNYTFSTYNLGAGLGTYTAASGTVNGSGSTSIIPQWWFGFTYTDNTNTIMPIMPTVKAFPNCTDSAGNHLNFTASTGAITCGTTSGGYSTIDSNGTGITQRSTVNFISGSNATVSCVDNAGSSRSDCTISASSAAGSRLDQITAATAANSINNGDNKQTWNWQLATASNIGFLVSENVASTATGTPVLFKVSSLSGSTANPVQFDFNGNGWRENTSGLLVQVGTGNIALPGTAHGLVISEGASTAEATTAAGTSGQILQSQGSSSDPGYFDFPDVKIVPAANCNNATAGAGWNLPATNAPTAACRAGTNNLDGILQWANNNTTTNAQFGFELPADWDTTSQPYISIYYGSGANTSGTVKWTFSSACSNPNGTITDDPAFVAETTSTGKSMAVANRQWNESVQFANMTSGNNCIAGSSVLIKITSGNGTATSTVNVSKVVITVPRLLKVQAN